MMSALSRGERVARVASQVRGFFPQILATSEFGLNCHPHEFPWASGPFEAMKISVVVPAKARTHCGVGSRCFASLSMTARFFRTFGQPVGVPP